MILVIFHEMKISFESNSLNEYLQDDFIRPYLSEGRVN